MVREEIFTEFALRARDTMNDMGSETRYIDAVSIILSYLEIDPGNGRAKVELVSIANEIGSIYFESRNSAYAKKLLDFISAYIPDIAGADDERIPSILARYHGLIAFVTLYGDLKIPECRSALLNCRACNESDRVGSQVGKDLDYYEEIMSSAQSQIKQGDINGYQRRAQAYNYLRHYDKARKEAMSFKANMTGNWNTYQNLAIADGLISDIDQNSRNHKELTGNDKPFSL